MKRVRRRVVEGTRQGECAICSTYGDLQVVRSEPARGLFRRIDLEAREVRWRQRCPSCGYEWSVPPPPE